MAKVFIEETTLTAIGDAIRGKEGTTELIPVTDMSTRITSLPSGGGGNEPTDEELTITGNCANRFTYDGWNWFINKYGNRITTKDITAASSMFASSSSLEEIPFPINVKDCSLCSSVLTQCQELKTAPKIRGTLKWVTNTSLSSLVSTCYNLRDVEDLFLPEMLDGFATVKVTSSYSTPQCNNFSSNYSLRRIPSWWYKFKLNEESTAYPSTTYCLYQTMLNACYVIDEALNIPVWRCQAAQTSNMFTNAFNRCHRLKDVTFETNSDGSAIVTQWKTQTIDLSNEIGYQTGNSFRITSYNSGITEDKMVKDDTTYQALKNDPDWFNQHQSYSRYDHDSAVRTINSLPDTSAYLATAGGTNTIKFKGDSGKNTDAGAINTLTEAEIAVATAKGWTVTIS